MPTITPAHFETYFNDRSDKNLNIIKNLINAAEDLDAAKQNYALIELLALDFRKACFPSNMKVNTAEGVLSCAVVGGLVEIMKDGAVTAAGPLIGAVTGAGVASVGTFFGEQLLEKRNKDYPTYMKLHELLELAQEKVSLFSEEVKHQVNFEAIGLRNRTN